MPGGGSNLDFVVSRQQVSGREPYLHRGDPTFWIELLYWQGGVDPEIATHECVASPFSLLYSCSAHVRPCAQGRCGRCPFGFGVMPDIFFVVFL